ncbi:MAG TPA: hypothetical protein VD710_10935 [Nitrososphaeraceae archaeon]|nr:hypothetical protein [Nitrososphaeraceae archaeon]
MKFSSNSKELREIKFESDRNHQIGNIKYGITEPEYMDCPNPTDSMKL